MLSPILISLVITLGISSGAGGPIRLETPALAVEVDPLTGSWFLIDKQSSVRWPTQGVCSSGRGRGLEGGFDQLTTGSGSVRLSRKEATAVTFSLVDGGRTLEIAHVGKAPQEVNLLGDFSVVTDQEAGSVVVPCREGLLIPADSGIAFQHEFGTSEYEGCHMNMLGLIKNASAMLVSWDGASVWAHVGSKLVTGTSHHQEIATELSLRPPAHVVRLTPLGKGDMNTLAAGYRRMAEQKGLAVTLRQKIGRDPHAERLLGAANVKLWTCLDRRMNEESTKVEHVRVHWTFDEAAQVAEHLRKDLGVDRCLFIVGGWTEGGYDCRHPDALPANSECGGDRALADAVTRIQNLGYIACLHDNYQDMYKDAKSWDPGMIQKQRDGSLMTGGRWLGGRAYLVCAPKQFELAMRPQNMPAIHERYGPLGYFIDTTYAVGPQECFDPMHPIGRDQDIAWKIRLSDESRKIFGLFGSECGREWALPRSDFFEGLVGVAGRDYHNLNPETLGGQVIPFWEMVYHDCQICYGKYGYDAGRSAGYVAHHLLAARPLNYHSIPDHLYWKEKARARISTDDLACFTRTDEGWAEGLHPVDAFLKTTHEVLGPLHLATAHDRLTRFEFLGPGHKLKKATYGAGQDATLVVVNEGAAPVAFPSRLGGSVLLPPWGFVIESPQFAAFHALRWNGRDYLASALFTLLPEDGKNLSVTRRLRVFHGFGDPRIDWRGATHEVRREAVIEVVETPRG
jgi:hypothetical protein